MRIVIAIALAAGVMGAMLPPTSVDSEAARLRGHFAVVLQELQARDVSSLTAEQRAARTTHIARLADYAARGVFPKNTDVAGQRVPYFIDRVGTRCAMAYLIEQSGSDAYVAAVARRMNNAYIDQIARDAELGDALTAWLAANGLTQSEAARIQPSYDGGGCCTIDPPAEKPATVATGYKIGTGAAVTIGVASLFLNATHLERGSAQHTVGWIGVGTGLVGLTLGGVALLEGKQYSTLGLLNVGVGAVATIAGLQSILSQGSRPQTVAIAPYVSPSGRSGVSMSLRF
jgi:hypothetical protein